MKNAIKYIVMLAVGVAIAASCNKVESPAQYFKPEYVPELEDVSPLYLYWACDDMDAQTITLTGKDLLPSSVTCVSTASTSAFNVNCNGDMVHVSPKKINTNPDNMIMEQLAVYVSEEKLYTITLAQGRMDKPLILSLTPSVVSWVYDDLSEKTIEIEALNYDPSIVQITSSSQDSHFIWSIEGTTIKATPKAVNESTESSFEETLTVSLGESSSKSLILKHSKAPKPSVVIYEARFDDPEATTAVSFKAKASTAVLDGRKWNLSYACVTKYYPIDGTSHILMSNRKNADTPYAESDNLLTETVTVTSFSVDLSRKADEGTCKIEYSYDGSTWIVADPGLNPLVSSNASEKYTYEVAESMETCDFRIRVSYVFDAAPSAYRFLHFEGVEIMGY